MEHALQRSEASETSMVDNFEESRPSRTSQEGGNHAVEADMIIHVESRSYAARIRVIILLSMICWALVIAGAMLIVG